MFLDRQACKNLAAYLFLPQLGSIFTHKRFGRVVTPLDFLTWLSRLQTIDEEI